MTVTINTDASHSPERNIGAYAFWIKSSIGKITHSGPLKGEIVSPNEAEIKAIANAFFALSKVVAAGVWPAVDRVFLNTDSKHAIHILTSGKKIKSETEKKSVDYILKSLELLGADMVVRHVKGHDHKNDKRHWVNAWCDREARHAMKKERAK